MATQDLSQLISRLEQVTSRLETLKVGGGSSSSGASNSAASVAPQVAAYDNYVSEYLQPFLNTCDKIGAPLDKAKAIIQTGFAEVRALIDRASKSKKPSDEELAPALAPISKVMNDLQNLRMDNRQSPFFNHLYAIDEGMKCLAWVSVPNITVSYVQGMVDSAQFYNNKVLVEFRKKEGGETHVQFVEQLKQSITELAAYVKENHMTGLTFNPRGGDFKSATASESAAPATSAPATAATSTSAPVKAAPQRPAMGGDLLASIKAKQDNAASGLSKVTDDMKTKNRTDNVSVVSSSTATKATGVVPRATVDKFNGTPRFELEKGVGEKWVVEYQKNNNALQITDTNLKQNVYAYRCLNSLITISGKVKNVAIDGCKKCGVIVDEVVGSIEFVNCESVKLQINGKCPIISVDKVDGFQLFLSKDSLDSKLVASKSSEMNINVPSKTDEDDYVESAVPEQFVTTYNVASGKFTTEVNSVFM